MKKNASLETMSVEFVVPERPRATTVFLLLTDRMYIPMITSLTLSAGSSVHITAQVLDQYGNLMPTAVPAITDPGPNTTFAVDAGTTGAGTLTGVTPGVDTLTATYQGLTATLPVTVSGAPSVATSIQFVSP